MRLLSPAKVNLYLKVFGKRKDGYHDVETLMVPISLYDTLEISITDNGINLSCSQSDLPEDQENMAYKAAILFLNSIQSNKGVNIHLHKSIPISSGLGGGSSNAASVLLGLNKLLGTNLPKGQLMDLGAQLGADVPFFILQRTAIARGIGNILEEFNNLPKLWFVLVYPEFPVSTEWVYRNLNLKLTRKKNNSISHKGKAVDVSKLLVNDLETVTITRYPIIEDIKKTLYRRGADGVLMTGSGPTVFGLFFGEKKALSVYEQLTQMKKWSISLVHSI